MHVKRYSSDIRGVTLDGWRRLQRIPVGVACSDYDIIECVLQRQSWKSKKKISNMLTELKLFNNMKTFTLLSRDATHELTNLTSSAVTS